MAAQKHTQMPIMETLIIWGANVNAADDKVGASGH